MFNWTTWGTSTPIAFSTAGGMAMGLQTQRVVEKLVQKLVIADGQRYDNYGLCFVYKEATSI